MKPLTIEKIRKMALAAFVIMGLMTGYVLVQIHMSLESVRQEFKAKQNEEEALTKDISRMETAIARFKQDIEDIQPYLFTERDVPAFLDSISKYAAENSVTVIDMQTQKFQEVVLPDEIKDSMMRTSRRRFDFDEPEEKNYSPEEIMTFAAMPIQIKIEGNFQALVDFLYALEGYQQLITLSNVEIEVTDKYPTLKCAFLLRIYSMKTLKELESI